MPRSARSTSLETRSARIKLRMRSSPHYVKVAKGLRLGYYRGAKGGTWYSQNGVRSSPRSGHFVRRSACPRRANRDHARTIGVRTRSDGAKCRF